MHMYEWGQNTVNVWWEYSWLVLSKSSIFNLNIFVIINITVNNINAILITIINIYNTWQSISVEYWQLLQDSLRILN